MTIQVLGDTSTDAKNQPLGSVYVPGTANSDLTPMEGVAITTDSNSKKSAAGVVAGKAVELSALTAGALNADLVASTDVSAYEDFTLTVSGTWSGTLTIAFSNDNSNFTASWVQASNTTAWVQTITTNGQYYIPKRGRYLRIRMTSYTSGTANGVLEQNTVPSALLSLGQMATADGAVLATVPLVAMGVSNGGSIDRVRDGSFGDNAQTGLMSTNSRLYNNSGWDRYRNNLDTLTLINASAVTTTQTSADQTNYNARLVYVVVNVATLAGTSPTLTPKLQGKGPVAVQYFQIGAAITAIAATGVFVYLFSLSAPAAAGGVTASAAFPVPRTWNFVMTAGGTITNATYTVEASYVL